MGLGGPEVKFGQIAPYFGDQNLHDLGCFCQPFGPILAQCLALMDQIVPSKDLVWTFDVKFTLRA